MKMLMMLVFASLSLVTFCAADEPKPDEIRFTVGFVVIDDNFFDRIGVDVDPKHQGFLLSDIEAFFLVCGDKSDKDEPVNPNWPKERIATINKPLVCRYATEAAGANFTVHMIARPLRDEILPVVIESPEGSTFTLREKVEVDLGAGDVFFVPATTKVGKSPKGKDLAVYLRIQRLRPDED